MSVDIVGVGARTPLGLRAAQSAAAYRAGISAMREHPFMIDRIGNAVAGALDSHLDPAVMGPRRLLALAETALREACARLEGATMPPRMGLPLYVSLSEPRPGFSAQDAAVVSTELARVNDLPIDVSDVHCSTTGHAGGLLLLAKAAEEIRHGRLDACLVGGVDSYFQPDTIEWLDGNRQLAGEDARSAFVPGEGAGFCLLMNDRGRAAWGVPALARLRAAAVGAEAKLIKTGDLCLGKGLTEVARSAISGLALPSERINNIICDINGERYRGEEWGFVCLHLSQHFDDPTAYWSPADSWGDLGAASGPLFVMLASEAAQRGYAKGPRTLVWASSEAGLRAAAVVIAPVAA